MFPPHQQRHVRLQLSNVLKGVISQRLIPRIEGTGRVAAVEVMISTGRVRELIDDQEKTAHLRDTIANGYTTYGMQTFDQALMDLVKRKVISYDEAIRQSSNPDDFKLKFSGIDSTSDSSWSDFERGKNQEDEAAKTKEEEGLDEDGQVEIERF